MRTQCIIAAPAFLSVILLIAGCGSDSADQLKQAQENLVKAEERAAAAEKERDAIRGMLNRCTLEKEQALNDVKFFAGKVNPLELRNFQQERQIEALTKELEKYKEALDAQKADKDNAGRDTGQDPAEHPE